MRSSGVWMLPLVVLLGGAGCDTVAQAAESASSVRLGNAMDPQAPRYTVFDESQRVSVKTLAEAERWSRGLRAEIRGTIGRRWSRGFLLRGAKNRTVLVVTRDGLAPSWRRVRGEPAVEVHGRLALAPRAFMHRLHGIGLHALDELVNEQGDVPHIRASEIVPR